MTTTLKTTNKLPHLVKLLLKTTPKSPVSYPIEATKQNNHPMFSAETDVEMT